MQIYKIFWRINDKCYAAIRTNVYNKSAAHFMMMLSIAITDYSYLTFQYDDIEIRIYEGDRAKGLMGIEFEIREPVEGYVEERPD